MIVVEGPDGAGKTRFATRLAKELELQIEPKAVSGEALAMVDMREWVERSVSQGFGRRLYDRHSLISELIYSPSMDKRWKPPHGDRQWLVNQLARFYSCQPIIIYCLPAFEIVWHNVQQDETSKVVQDRQLMQRIYKLYEARVAIDLAISDATVRVWDYLHDADTGHFEAIVRTCQATFAMNGFHADAH
jgi:shikimate kinase